MKLVLAFSFLLLTALPARAIVTGSATLNGDGTYTYSYEIDNTFGTFDVIGWTLELSLLPTEIDWDPNDIVFGGDVTVPSRLVRPEQRFQVWAAVRRRISFRLGATGDVPAGQTLSGFSFTSAFAPVSTAFTLEFGALGESLRGSTIGPGRAAAVPDKAPSVLLLSFACAALGLGRRMLRVQPR